jgi:hypothetical protein
MRPTRLFPATFFIAVMKAIGRENVNLEDV